MQWEGTWNVSCIRESKICCKADHTYKYNLVQPLTPCFLLPQPKNMKKNISFTVGVHKIRAPPSYTFCTSLNCSPPSAWIATIAARFGSVFSFTLQLTNYGLRKFKWISAAKKNTCGGRHEVAHLSGVAVLAQGSSAWNSAIHVKYVSIVSLWVSFLRSNAVWRLGWLALSICLETPWFAGSCWQSSRDYPAHREAMDWPLGHALWTTLQVWPPRLGVRSARSTLHAFIHAGAGFLPPDESSSVDERVASIQQTWRWFWRQVGADGLLIAMVLMKVLMKLLITKVLMSNPGLLCDDFILLWLCRQSTRFHATITSHIQSGDIDTYMKFSKSQKHQSLTWAVAFPRCADG